MMVPQETAWWHDPYLSMPIVDVYQCTVMTTTAAAAAVTICLINQCWRCLQGGPVTSWLDAHTDKSPKLIQARPRWLLSFRRLIVKTYSNVIDNNNNYSTYCAGLWSYMTSCTRVQLCRVHDASDGCFVCTHGASWQRCASWRDSCCINMVTSEHIGQLKMMENFRHVE